MEQKQIPFFNYSALASEHEEEFVSIFRDVIHRGAFILQRDLAEFEDKAKNFLGIKHFLGVADGTNALVLVLRALGIGPGDEVIVPSHTYIASAAAVHLVGATPVLVECGWDHLIDPESVSAAITSKTKAIMPVHLNGRTCAMEPLKALAGEHGLRIVEDAAQAFGSRYRGKAAGGLGDAGTFSFYPAKVLACFGDGGGVATNDDSLFDRLYWLRDHGRDKTGEVIGWGTNCRLDNLQAAFLSFKLDHLTDYIRRRREIAAFYHRELSSIKDLTLPPPPQESGDNFDTFQNYELESGSRAALRSYLDEHGIKTLIQWGGKAVHQFPHLAQRYTLPKTSHLFTRCFMLPMNPSLSDADLSYICSAIHGFYREKS
jgi:dTDP-4-amino-4,6-dideoxygalactose transaminase